MIKLVRIARAAKAISKLAEGAEDEALAEWEIHAAELVLGYDLADLRGPIPDGWSTPTQIGHRLGVSAHRVGMATGGRGATPRSFSAAYRRPRCRGSSPTASGDGSP